MNAIEIYENADRKLNKSEITLGEYERMIDPLRNVIPIPEGATNGDMIKAMLQVVGYTPLSTWSEKNRKKSGFHVHIQGEFKTDFRLTVSEDWWNAKYKGVEE